MPRLPLKVKSGSPSGSYSGVTLFFLALSAMLLFNRHHLTDPPYWDALMGIYRQGVWLARHGLNYALLIHVPTYGLGGAQIGIFYAFAGLFAGLSLVFSPANVFLVMHVFIMTLAAVYLALYYKVLKTDMPGLVASAWILAGASHPIWSAQTASLYIDLPAAALMGVSGFFLWQGRYGWASATLLIAYFVKNTVFLQATAYAVLGVLIVLGMMADRREQSPSYRILWLFLPVLVMPLWDRLQGGHLAADPIRISDFLVYVKRFAGLAPHLYPDLVVELVLMAGLLLSQCRDFSRLKRIITSQDPREQFWVLQGILIFGFWFAFILTPRNLIRYTVLIHLPMAILLAFALRRHPRLSLLLALGLILFHGFNQQGQLLGPLPNFAGRSGDRLERSREYLIDLQSDRDLCHWLERQAGQTPVLVKWPFAQMLAFPELGYVSQPLSGIVDLNHPSLIEESASGREALRKTIDRRTLCIYAPSIFEIDGVPLHPRPGDKILWIDKRLPAPLILFERQWTQAEWNALLETTKVH